MRICVEMTPPTLLPLCFLPPICPSCSSVLSLLPSLLLVATLALPGQEEVGCELTYFRAECFEKATTFFCRLVTYKRRLLLLVRRFKTRYEWGWSMYNNLVSSQWMMTHHNRFLQGPSHWPQGDYGIRVRSFMWKEMHWFVAFVCLLKWFVCLFFACVFISYCCDQSCEMSHIWRIYLCKFFAG